MASAYSHVCTGGQLDWSARICGILAKPHWWFLHCRRSQGEKEKGSGYAGAAAEVCKYALKFGDLSVEKTWEAFKILKGRRLTGSFGLLWGVKIPEEATDELPDDQSLPYLEMLYKFNYAKQSYYDLVVTRNVEPKAKAELGGGGAATTDRRCEAVALATKDEAIIFGRGEGAQHVKMKRGRKKPTGKYLHWLGLGFAIASTDGMAFCITLTFFHLWKGGS